MEYNNAPFFKRKWGYLFLLPIITTFTKCKIGYNGEEKANQVLADLRFYKRYIHKKEKGIMMPNTAKLSQNTAILLEYARRNGVADEAIVANIAAGDTSIFEKVESQHYHYDEFYSYAKEYGEDLLTAIQEGYRIKFNTVNGLNVWLENRFGLVANKDFETELGKKLNIHVTENEARDIYETVAENWITHISFDGINFVAAKEIFQTLGDPQKHVTVNLFIRTAVV